MKESTLLPKKNRIFTAVFLLACFLFLTVLARGFPVTCDDWFLFPHHPFIGLYDAYYRGFTWARATAVCFNGRYLGNFLAGFVASSELLRHALICLGITGIIALVLRLCRIRSLTGRILAATLVIALPAPMFAQTYAWSAGYFNYVPPVLCVLGYVCLLFSVFQGRKHSPWLLIPVFLLGLCGQFFVENITLGMCLLSFGAVLVYRIREKKLSAPLVAHLLGAILGCILMFMATGYGAIGTEEDAYRTMGGGLMEIALLAGKNLTRITDQMTGNNWLVILPLSALCYQLCGRQSGRGRLLSRGSLVFCVLFFLVNRLWLMPLRDNELLAYIVCSLALLVNGIYLLTLCWVFFTCIRDKALRWRLLYLFGSGVIFLLPLAVVSPVSERCLYLSHILWICGLFCLWNGAFAGKFSPSKGKRTVLIALCALILLGYQWMMQCNAGAEAYRIQLTEAAMERGQTHIVLPGYPYEAYVHGEESPAIESYYYYHTDGDITFSLVDYEDWDFTAHQPK